MKSLVKEILDLCKAGKQESVKFTELGRDMFKENKYILSKYFRNEFGQDCYYANLLAFKDMKDSMSLKDLKAILEADFKMKISLAGYKYNPEHYKFSTCYMQNEYEEDLFKDNDRSEEIIESMDQDRFNRRVPLDYDAVESLCKVLFKAIKARRVMIFHLEDIPGIINNAIECNALGVSNIPSNNVMHAKLAEIERLISDKEVMEWLKTCPTDLMFDKFDYVDTYQKVLRQMTNIRDEVLEYCADFIHNEEDLFEDEILANNYIDFETLYESGEDDEDYLVNND